jgi:hypothetical protein
MEVVMSGLGILTVLAFSALSLWGVVMGVRGCMADSKPFMQGEGAKARFDGRMSHAA